MQDLTVVCIDGRIGAAADLSKKALFRSSEALGASSVFCGEGGESPCPNFSDSEEYSEWLLKNAYKLFDTEFALFVQSDGFVLDASKFEKEFLYYDYIGAPWPAHWPNSSINRVGNGGFSLRSKRLMEFVAQLPLNCLSYKDSSGAMPIVEDTAICIFFKELIESQGFTFAPVDLAAQFSFENHTEFSPFDTFGFHGKTNELTRSYCKLL